MVRIDSLLDFSLGRKMPIVLQTEAAECGLSCLAMLAGYYGFYVDMPSLRQRFSVSSHGTNLKHLMEMAGRIHLQSRAVSLETSELQQLQMPCILHWDLNHFVVLQSSSSKGLTIIDPAFGKRRLTEEEFNHHFTGIALELTPTPAFEKGADVKRLGFSDFWTRIYGLKQSLIYTFVLALLMQFFAILSPFYMQTVVDDAILRQDKNLLLTLALGFGLLVLIQSGTGVLRSLVLMQFSNRLGIQMSANVFRHLIRLPMNYFQKRHIGDIVSRFGSLESVRTLISSGIVSAIIDGILAVITLVVMFIYSIKLAVIVLIVVAIYAAIRYVFYRPLRQVTEESIVASAKHDSHFMETVRAIQTIKLSQRENDRQGQWQNLLADSTNKKIRIGYWNLGYDTANELLFGIENIIVIFFAAASVMENTMSIGMLFAFMSYKIRFTSATNNLISQWVSFKMIDVQLNRLADITHTEAENIDDQIAVIPAAGDAQRSFGASMDHFTPLGGKIEVRSLGYRYGENDPFVFRSLNFVIEARETVVIVGPSGCGKSTLLLCLMGLIKPTEGEILVDDIPLANRKDYRGQIAGVMQDDQLISGSILNNIASFEPDVDVSWVVECAKLACVHDEIIRLPMQYNTLVSDMGTGLSGGQKQRIVLARALYRKPRMLFMDEATSHLDANNEMRVNQHIQRLNMTRILIAHRQETVRSAERQIDLEKLTDGPQ